MTGVALPVREPVHVRQARQQTGVLAREAGLSERDVERVAIAATELAGNLVKYAVDGLLMAIGRPGAFDLIATDRGPGLRHVEDSMRDGYSTSGTLGIGLGGVRRMADEFDIFSRYGEGTVVLARWLVGLRPPLGVRPGVAMFTALGETVCGDSWVVAERDGITTVAVSDGLGHGPEAAVASAAATAHVSADPTASPSELIAAMDADGTARRGATVAVAQFHPARSTMLFCGVGNTTVRLFSPRGDHETLVSVPGIVGRRQRRGSRVQPLTRPWSDGNWLIMHTDGVSERWGDEELSGAFDRDPATVAGWLLGRHVRRRDDACVLVAAGGAGP
ncbi:anti-sigma regulatory factor (Ser/Thr protein kinase) [Saccharomonospora marina XMU15]|uniref:Anti-sigma regulatory factor (Ser/Thr protein kinase) n=1 Tax=Saccharomonospora marina XMU15 TaxID=882083 RepID=H5XAV0_9PSEU|nr:SpoIIE family protein phosphatase [Saccharomonospora marina]EHR52660.1 anti-sigma regulatory factor (Ser/Thr protein kinase) [Saccharomonospora marina XMU15]